MKPEKKSDLKSRDSNKHSWIVGIGASAGGLEAIEKFFTNCPTNLDITFVVIQHLSSNYKSMMDDLIHRYTQMPVKMVSNAMPIEKNTIFLIPAGTVITLNNDIFYVKEKDAKKLTLPIDIFFKSLADNSQEKAISVVLSGTGSDGSRGAMDINAQGGFVIAQEPEDAKFDGMPNSLINTGIVDEVMPGNEIPARIEKHIKSPVSLRPAKVEEQSSPPENATVDTIIQVLISKCHIDFSQYKWATFSRRLERRMQVKQVRNIQAYCDILCTDESEIKALRREQLIPVTSFFRDTEVFEELQKSVIPELVKKANNIDGVRVWVAGVSTGEEAYSLAMLIKEEISNQGRSLGLKIFATDVNPEIIEFGAAGAYPLSIASEVPAEFISKYFIKNDQSLCIRPDIRQSIVFAKHNILSDPPFTKMDLVSCRNTLIYFKSKAQLSAVQKLQYSVKKGGVLLLGKSESLTINTSHFDPIDSRLKIFRCRHAIRLLEFDAKMSGPVLPIKKGKNPAPGSNDALNQIIELGRTQLIEQYVPISLVVNDQFEVVHFYGDPGLLMQYHEGPVSNNLSHILNKKLVPIVTALLFRLRKEGGVLSSENIVLDVLSDGKSHTVRITGDLLTDAELEPYYILTIDIKHSEPTKMNVKPLDIDASTQGHIEQLENELNATRESLQATIEELETTNEELQATNEELMASNEELQSSNEELQSVNEELNTVNAEYHEKMNILNQINADLDAMSKATAVATIFVDQSLNITRFTPDLGGVYKIRDTDIGRPLEEINHNLIYPDLHNDITATMNSGRLFEKEVKAKNGDSYLVRLVDYRLSPTKSGLVLSFIDITALKASEQLKTILDALPEHIAVLDHSGTIVMVNQAWQRFGSANGEVNERSSIGANYLNVCHHADGDIAAKKAYFGVKSVLEGTRVRFSLEYPCDSPDEERWFAMEVVAINHSKFAAVVSHFNISSWKTKQYEQD